MCLPGQVELRRQNGFMYLKQIPVLVGKGGGDLETGVEKGSCNCDGEAKA